MGKLVNVVLPGGRVVSVPEEVANKISGNDVAHQESLAESAARSTSNLNAERSSGLVEGVKAAAEGFIDAATIGAYGAIRNAVDPNARNAQIRAQERPGARIFGELAAVLAPTGALGKTARAVGEALPLTAASRALGTTGTAARLTEGAVYGVAGSISHANVSGDPLSIEGIVTDAGVGALINFGLGKVADGLLGASKKAKATLAAEDEADKAVNLFHSTPESYNELVTAHKATVQSAKAAQKQWDKAAKEYYDEFQKIGSDPKELRGIIAQVDVMERRALNQITKGKRMADLPMKSAPGEYAVALSEADKAALQQVRKVLSEGRTAATTAFKQGAYGTSVTKLASAIEDAKAIIPDLDLPALPSIAKFGDRPVIPDIISLPKDLKGFAKLHPDTIAKLANSAPPGSSLAQAIEKFTADIGLEGATTASATLAGTHATLNSMANSLAKKEASGQTVLDALRINSKRAVRYGVGRVADTALGGGFIGASGRTIVGGMVGYGLNGVEGALIGASLLNAKARVKSTITNIFAKYGEGASKVVTNLAPISSYLKTRLDGEEDKETDIRTLALNRATELQAVAGSITDTAFTTVQPLLNQPGDIAYKIHNTLVNTVGMLNGTTPKDPGLATNMFNSYWKPTHGEALKMAHAMEAALYPIRAIERLISGKSDPIAADVLWSAWPAHMTEAATELVNNAQYLGNLTREQSSALGNLFRVPLNGFQQPEVIAQLQSYFLPKPLPNESTPPSKMPTGNPTGRPPKVFSPNPSQSRVSQLQR